MEWISVKDKLPKYGDEVLFVNGKNKVSVGQLMPFEPNANIWATEKSIYFNDSIECEYCVCKFWMPLPPPPKKD